jgi:hypothetical protein
LDHEVGTRDTHLQHVCRRGGAGTYLCMQFFSLIYTWAKHLYIKCQWQTLSYNIYKSFEEVLYKILK